MSAELPKMPQGQTATALFYSDLGNKADVFFYTADQMRTFAQEAARQAMERCGAMCDATYLVRHAQGFPREASTARNLRDAIRALIDQPEKRHG